MKTSKTTKTLNSAEEKITEVLKKLKLKTNRKFISRGWWILGPSIIIGGGTSASYLYFHTITPTIIGALIVLGGLLGSMSFFIKARTINQVNERILKEQAPELYKMYFENNSDLFSTALDFKFDGFFPSQIYKTTCLQFSLGKEKVTWNIDEDIEQRTVPIPVGKGRTIYQTYFVYILKCSLLSTAQKLNGFNEINVYEGKIPKSNNERFFKSESIAFNERFCVEGWNQTDIYKLFTPKVIDNFINTEPSFLKTKIIRLSDGRAEISWRGPEKLKSWVPDFSDFSKIRWSKDKMIDDILTKIDLDFNRYLDIQTMLSPLELYE